ncbi:MAG TPA: Hsp20/alpha crystallin family protein [Longimicrobium sp.]|nr:Hsp20/alpha crystallin family protein [Longimicrobium sp.]
MAISMNPTLDVFGPLFDDALLPLASGRRMGAALAVPHADVAETESEIRVWMELPGLRPRDVNVDLDNNVLTVSGEKQATRSEGDERHTWHLAERRYGRFSRSFVLPREVDADGVRAEFDNGILTVTVPKTERARRRRIEIRGAGQTQSLNAGPAEGGQAS